MIAKYFQVPIKENLMNNIDGEASNDMKTAEKNFAPKPKVDKHLYKYFSNFYFGLEIIICCRK